MTDPSHDEHPDHDHDKHQRNGDGRLDGQAALVPDVGLDLCLEVRPRLNLRQAGIATLPVFSVLSQIASALRSSLM